MAHGHERPQLMYGGKSKSGPSHQEVTVANAQLSCPHRLWPSSVGPSYSAFRALAYLSASLDIDGPWTFHLRNPRNPTVNQTHAGVLEFIAEEGIVHLPAWVCLPADMKKREQGC